MSQDVIRKDEERMTKNTDISGQAAKMDIAPIPSSTIWKGKVYPIRSAKHRTIKPMGNIEICEVGVTFRTIQCPIVLDIFQRRNSRLPVLYKSYALASTNRKGSRIELASSNQLYIMKGGQSGEHHGPA